MQMGMLDWEEEHSDDEGEADLTETRILKLEERGSPA